MDKFEFFFALLSLLLGLAMTQLASGIASAIKRRECLEVGWLTPLAALVICLDIASFWPTLWGLRASVEISLAHVLIGVGLCLAYYIAAAMVFPDDYEGVTSLDDWFFTNRRFALGGTLAIAITLSAITKMLALDRFMQMSFLELLWSHRGWILYILLLGIAMLARTKRLAGAGLAMIILLYPVAPFIF